MESFIVSTKDLFDRRKNPKLSFSVKDILQNDRVGKISVEKSKCCNIPKQFSTNTQSWFCPKCGK